MGRSSTGPVPRPALRGGGGSSSSSRVVGESGFDRRVVRWIRLRVRVMGGLLAVMFAIVSYRVFDLQVLQGERLGQMAEQKALGQVVLTPRRGVIADRNGDPLAISVEVDSVFVEPTRVEDRHEVVSALADALSLDPAALEGRMQRGRHFAWVKRRVSPAEARRVRELGLTGVHLTKEARRFYPQKQLAAHVLGFAGIDGVGLEGIEMSLDVDLRGIARTADVLRDARGRQLIPGGNLHVDRLEGGSVTLTLDRTLQYHAEAALAEAVKETEAKSASVVVLDPRTGEILALATRPTFNPNRPGDVHGGWRRNRAITDLYEPGSVFKVFSIASVLDAGLASPEDVIDCEKGSARIGGRTIRDANPHGELTIAEIMKVSSNIGSARLVERLGKQSLVDALAEFGFGRRTGVGMPGERAGHLRSASDMSDVCLATLAFGQGVSSTPLQVASALAAVANGGRLMRPWIVREVRDEEGRVRRKGQAELISTPIQESTASAVTGMMEAVVREGGTGWRAAVPGYRIAGKTGTSQKVDPLTRGYCSHRRVASFGGFVPVEDPRLVIMVVVDEPQGVKYGGVVAAPVFRRVAEEAVSYLGISPSEPVEDPPVLAAFDEREAGAGIVLPGFLVPPPEGKTLVPNVSGLDLRGALKVLAERHLEARPEGAGLVTEQDPPAGEIVSPGELVTLRLGPTG